MDFIDIKNKIEAYQSEGKNLFATSSFQTHSIALLHIISRIDKSIPVYFINTGFLFAETIAYKNQITKLLDLNVIDTKPMVSKNLQKDIAGNFYFTSDPDYCCFLNKTQPLENVMHQYDIWINGVRADQSDFRKNLNIEQEAKNNVLRFHPMLDWDKRKIYAYLSEYDIPHHPLDSKGYVSIGCEPCTRKIDLNEPDRNGRWFGQNKTECGINTDLIK